MTKIKNAISLDSLRLLSQVFDLNDNHITVATMSDRVAEVEERRMQFFFFLNELLKNRQYLLVAMLPTPHPEWVRKLGGRNRRYPA